MEQFVQEKIDEFLQLTSPFKAAYSDPQFFYLASTNGDGKPLVIRSRLYLKRNPQVGPRPTFRTKSVVAGSFSLRDADISLDEFLLRAAAGQIECNDGEMRLDLDMLSAPKVTPFFALNGLHQHRVSRLSFLGRDIESAFAFPDINWELRGAAIPYDSLYELMQDFNLAGAHEVSDSLEVFASFVGEIIYGSDVQATEAKPRFYIDSQLDRSKVSVGVRELAQGRVVRRLRFSANEIEWTMDDDRVWGTFQLAISESALLHCYLAYDGVVTHVAWLRDPAAARSPLKAILETADSNLTVLGNLLHVEGRGASRDLERGVAWLAWLLGFSPLHLTDKQLSDAADVIAVSPQGSVIVIECTTGMLKGDNKLGHLASRTEKIKQALQSTGYPTTKVFPVIVSNRPRRELRADLSQARELGIIVVSLEDIDEALRIRLLLPAKPDQMLAEVEQQLGKLLRVAP